MIIHSIHPFGIIVNSKVVSRLSHFFFFIA